MKIGQLRNATAIVESGAHRILVDPMLAPRGALPALKLFGDRRRNPLVELPDGTGALLETVTHCLITHCRKGHFDHLDRAGKRWLRERGTPVFCAPDDAAHLRARGLNAVPLQPGHGWQPFLEGRIRTVPCVHGYGLVGGLMAHGVGYHIEMPGEPDLYITGDTVLTDTVRDFVRAARPRVILAPAGGARFDLGGDIIMGKEELVELAALSGAAVVANHLEALSHCPVTRAEVASSAAAAGLAERVLVPADGESVAFAA